MTLVDFLKWVSTSIIPFFLGVLWQSWRASSTEIASQINDLLKDLRSLEEISTEYWTTDHGEPKNSMRQARIRGLCFSIAHFEAQAEAIFGDATATYRDLVDEVIATSTGGSFETAKRKPDYERAVRVQQAAAKIAATARVARRDSAGMRYAASYASRRASTAFWWLMRSIKEIGADMVYFYGYPFRWLWSKLRSGSAF